MSGNDTSLHIFEVLAKQHEAMLLAYVLALVSDRALAEDVCQQSFIIAYRKIGELRDPAVFPAWLRGIARLEAMNARRRRMREVPVEPETLAALDETYRRLEEVTPAESWEERFGRVERCFDRLPDGLRTVCAQHYVDGLKAREIADALALSLATVLKRLERARQALRECVEAQLQGET
jgi:RNA polymerase sigma factor (sigma-70 family)